MDKKQAKLLLKLADHLHNFKEPKKGEKGVGFDMAAYYTDQIGDWCQRPHPCGTAACAMGHAGMMPAFHRVGIKTNKQSGRMELDGCRANCYEMAVRLGMDDEEFLFLFDDHERTARQEAKIIRDFVKAKMPELAV